MDGIRGNHGTWEGNMAEVLLTTNDDGRTIETAVGDSLLIELPENPTTGYRWTQEAGSPPAVHLCGSSFDRDTSGAFGAPGIRSFRYEILDRGEGPMRFRCWQEWEDEASITETFSVVVVVRH